MATTATDWRVEALRELAVDIEAARDRGGRWFGRYSMRPIAVSDWSVNRLRLAGLVRVVEWDDGPEDLRRVFDIDDPRGYREVRTRAQPRFVQLTACGWVLLDR